MAKKKQSKSKQPSQPKPQTFSSTLSSQLSQLAAKPSEASASAPSSAKPTPVQAPTPAPAAPPAASFDDAPARLSDEQLFEHALDQLDAKKIFQGKFVGEGVALPKPAAKPAKAVVADATQRALSDAEREAQEAQAREVAQELREEAIFVRTVGYIDRLGDTQKYYKPKPGTHISRFDAMRDRGYTTEYPSGLLTPPLPKEGDGLHSVELNADQKGLLNRFKLTTRQQGCSTLNLHGESLEDALRQLELFVHQEHKNGATYIRLVHGKGLNSEDGKPVLKPAVLQWLEGPGLRYIRGYAPEVGADKNYGSLVVLLDKRPPARRAKED